MQHTAGMDLSGTRLCRVPESCPWDTNLKQIVSVDFWTRLREGGVILYLFMAFFKDKVATRVATRVAIRVAVAIRYPEKFRK